MNCPACDTDLTERTVDGVALDVCEGGCGGIWFDKDELLAFAEPHECPSSGLLDVPRDPTIQIDPERRHHCPRCETYVMQRHFFSVKMAVEVDECPGCGGMWLDAGELASIRSLYDTEADRKAAAQDFWNDVGKHELPALDHQLQQDDARSTRIANMFRFLCPSAWLPGKQRWGAF